MDCKNQETPILVCGNCPIQAGTSITMVCVLVYARGSVLDEQCRLHLICVMCTVGIKQSLKAMFSLSILWELNKFFAQLRNSPLCFLNNKDPTLLNEVKK
eukprot:TRINITY_DN13264_c2_g1_i1.p1 TRINITY_DN13264_c2_g1~~TRINITY_DN13264_c2_g1_i1.p1  ORF type:complete len:100 (-),score=10.74 TRINITY_DN13264_c2_g1_i1:1485-1784(-)